MQPGTTDDRFNMTSDYTLVLRDCRQNDTAVYTCQISTQGTFSSSTNLTVMPGIYTQISQFYNPYHQLSVESQKGVLTYSMMFYCESVGRCCCTKSVVITPFWFSREQCRTALTPFWLSAHDVYYEWPIYSKNPFKGQVQYIAHAKCPWYVIFNGCTSLSSWAQFLYWSIKIVLGKGAE